MNPGVYFNSRGQVDQTITPIVMTVSPLEFSKLFNYAWAESLLPHHPEYSKLVFAEDHLQTSYNWIDNLNQVGTFSDASGYGYTTGIVNDDPFFGTGEDTSAITAMEQFVSGTGGSAWRGGLSLWQIAYGNVECNSGTS